LEKFTLSKLNDTKTNILVIAPPAIQSKIVVRGVFIHGKCIRFSDSAKNLGILIDSTLSFEAQIKKLIKECFAFIKDLYSILIYLTMDHLKTLICSYIFQRIDYCNALYYGLNEALITRLQLVQNAAARILKKKFNLPSLDHVFHQMHWLKVKESSIDKILVISHKCMAGCAPQTLNNMFQLSRGDRRCLVKETRVQNVFGERAFSHLGPKLWNLLPQTIRAEPDVEKFKKSLKTYLMLHSQTFIERSKLR